MKNKYEKIRLEWINFLERFSAKQLDIKFDKTETIYVSFIMENILDTNISFSSVYGFLTVSFTEGKTMSRFFEIMKSFSEYNKDENHNNFIINYPCKVFENKLMFQLSSTFSSDKTSTIFFFNSSFSFISTSLEILSI